MKRASRFHGLVMQIHSLTTWKRSTNLIRNFSERSEVSGEGKGACTPEGLESAVEIAVADLLGVSPAGELKAVETKSVETTAEKIEPKLKEWLDSHDRSYWRPNTFQFTSKQQGLSVRGSVRVDSAEYRFDAENEAFACLDFGRGRWPSRIHWYWAFASGVQGGHTIGFNLGGKWTDGTGVTENGLVIDGSLQKISDDVDFSHDPRSFMLPWRIRTRGSDRVDLTFKPMRERVVKLPLLLASADLHQCVGKFSGIIAGIRLDEILGLAESFRGRW